MGGFRGLCCTDVGGRSEIRVGVDSPRDAHCPGNWALSGSVWTCGVEAVKYRCLCGNQLPVWPSCVLPAAWLVTGSLPGHRLCAWVSLVLPVALGLAPEGF